MKGYATTYLGMFDPPDGDRPAVTAVEIPIIQRDYAQGRPEEEAVRQLFVDVLVRAATTDAVAGLDFVYGEVVDGTLKPLDGQQRLTTLFLLHWYVASRAGTLEDSEPWTRFSYATRPSAELFCRELVKRSFLGGTTKPSAWITDQSWYLFPWRHDPTISGMLVMLDALHDRFAIEPSDFSEVWDRLNNRDTKAISYLLLPISDMGSGEELYIKMNSRGKPLNPFEVSKARLEMVLETSDRHKQLAEKFDRDWSDLLWQYETDKFQIDDGFLRYLEFIIDVCEWRDGELRSNQSLDDRARLAFSPGNKSHARNLDFLFHAFDTWVGTKPRLEFEALFTIKDSENGELRLFESKSNDLFGECLRSYGLNFSLTETLLLYAVLVHRQNVPEGDRASLASGLRALRNLAESAPDEVRAEFMPALIDATERLIVNGSLENLTRFNQARVEDEQRKREFRKQNPHLTGVVDQLEDHALLRGRLYAIDLDPEQIVRRAQAFADLFERENWAELTGALLAQGDYSRQRSKYRQFGSSIPEKETIWRELITAGSREQQTALRDAVSGLLDHSAVRDTHDCKAALNAVSAEFCATREAASDPEFDWRYYMVKYPIMRTGPSGAYVAETYREDGARPLGYSLCMLNTTTLGGYFRDPYLAAIRELSGVGNRATDPIYIDQHESHPRRMTLDSGVTILCFTTGLLLEPPTVAKLTGKFHDICSRFGVGDDGVLEVNQREVRTERVDVEDRVKLGADLLKLLVEAGL